MIAPATVLKPCGDVRYRVVDRQAVVIRQGEGEAVVLNEVGARVLGLIDERLPVAQLLDRMAQGFDADRVVLERDLLDFLQELLDTGIAEEA